MSVLEDYLKRPPAITKLAPHKEDVTNSFFEVCSKLKQGEVKLQDGFRLNDAMSAIEILDPNMDIGAVRHRRETSVASLTTQGYFERVTLKEVLTIMDASFACMATHLDGANVAASVYTNVLLVDANNIPDPLLRVIAHGFVMILTYSRAVIVASMVYEEEDYSITQPYEINNVYKPSEISALLRERELDLRKKAKAKCADWELMEAIAERLLWLHSFIDFLEQMVPPMRIPPFSDTATANGFKPNCANGVTLTKKLVSASKTFESSYKMGISKEAQEGGFCDGDGDFGWLTVFDPWYNKMHMTGAFTRVCRLVNRAEGLKYFRNLSFRLHTISAVIPPTLDEYWSILHSFKAFNGGNSCILSRSILQLVVLPYDDCILGETPLSDIVDTAVRTMTAPLCVNEGSPHRKDSTLTNYYLDFTDYITKVSLSIISTYGLNLARQRSKLKVCIEDVLQAEELATRFDSLSRKISSENPNKLPRNHPQLSLTCFLYHLAYSLVRYHVDLSFHLNLFAPHEYVYIYWYLAEVVFLFGIEQSERGIMLANFLHTEHTAKVAMSDRQIKKKNTRAIKQEGDAIEKRFLVSNNSILRKLGEIELCRGVTKTTVAMIKMKKLEIPVWDENTERHRYEQRMRPFNQHGCPFSVDYDRFNKCSLTHQLYEMDLDKLLAAALDHFSNAALRFSQYCLRSNDANLIELKKLATSNMIAVRVLSTTDCSNRKIEWIPPEPQAFAKYPVLKIY